MIGFERLLAILDANPEAAARRYERLRLRLIAFFRWEGFPDADDLADLTFDRTARKIIEGEDVRDVERYLLAVARFVSKESLADAQRQRKLAQELAARPVPEVDEKAFDCLEKCLGSVSDEQRSFILRYYHGDRGAKIDNRKQMATDLNLSLNTLRNRALRIRDRLETCVRDCVREKKPQ